MQEQFQFTGVKIILSVSSPIIFRTHAVSVLWVQLFLELFSPTMFSARTVSVRQEFGFY